MAKQQLTPKSEDMSKWYTQVIQQAKLADYSPIKGCMVIRPNGYGIWENIQTVLNSLLRKLDIENAYFPIFIPMSFLKKEAKHVEGFAPELAVVTHAGGEKLKEELVVRPTSETIMYDMYSKWVQSYRDLPVLLNQWNNVVRWEKRTYFFLRTSEFLWQEGHTAHATHEEAVDMVLSGLEAYRTISEDLLAVPVIKGRKSESEKFAGAAMTTTIESMMPDGKALQSGTSHDLAQNFSKKEAFNIGFSNAKGDKDYVWQTSFGLSTRIIGSIIMTHGDDDGLVLPPKAAAHQVSIIPVEDSPEIIETKDKLVKELRAAGMRVKVLGNIEHRMGWRLNESEIQGIPLAVVIGKQEVESKEFSVKVRYNHENKQLPVEKASREIQNLLEEIQTNMFKKAQENMKSLITEVEDYEQFKKVMSDKRGFIKAFWCESSECEKQIKEETKATTRCLPFVNDKGDVLEEKGVCIKCGLVANHRWLFAQAY